MLYIFELNYKYLLRAHIYTFVIYYLKLKITFIPKKWTCKEIFFKIVLMVRIESQWNNFIALQMTAKRRTEPRVRPKRPTESRSYYMAFDLRENLRNELKLFSGNLLRIVFAFRVLFHYFTPVRCMPKNFLYFVCWF